ncbi:MAG: helix-turn-helix domain-containing protein [Gammaproteobacteria bacterium]
MTDDAAVIYSLSMALPPHKKKALAASGTLNPQPEAVANELFTTHPFFDAHDRAQVKYEMLRSQQLEGLTVTAACRQFGFSREGFYQIRNAFSERGFACLLPDKPGRKGPSKLKDEALKFALEQHERHPQLDPASLAARVRERYGVEVHRTTVMRALKKKRRKTASSHRMQRRR